MRTLVQSPHDPEGFIRGNRKRWNFKSTDGGKNWEKVNKGLSSLTIYAIEFDPKDSNIIYAWWISNGVCRSNDGGNSWICFSEGLGKFNSIHSIAVHPDISNFVVAGTIDGGVYISEDGGKTWRYAGLEGAEVWTVHIE